MPERSKRDFFRDILIFALIVFSGALVFTFLIKTLLGDKQIPNVAAVVAHIATPETRVNADLVSPLKGLPSESARKTFTGTYAAAGLHKAFAVSNEGYWGYATQLSTAVLAGRTAVWWCETLRSEKSKQDACKVVHLDGAWLSENAKQTHYSVEIDHIRRGIMPSTLEFISGEYAQAQGHKALATSTDGYYGYATDFGSVNQAVEAAMGYCEDAARKQGQAVQCHIQLINDEWQ
ncbi:MAG: hypothetical protein ACSHXK_14190 [Oceanococcus sp.]